MFTHCIIDTPTLDFPESKLFILDSQVSFLVHHNMFSLTIHFQTFSPASNHNQNPQSPGLWNALESFAMIGAWLMIPPQLKELPIASKTTHTRKPSLSRDPVASNNPLLPFHTHTFGAKRSWLFPDALYPLLLAKLCRAGCAVFPDCLYRRRWEDGNCCNR